ncbi:hypothetical protein ACLOJK_016319 [Asimina triloba]
MLAAKRAIPSALLSKLVSPVRSIAAAPSSARALNSNAQTREREDRRDMVIDPRSDRPALSPRRDDFLTADVFDPFFPPTHSLGQMLNLMDQMLESTFPALTRGMAVVPGRGWDAREDEECLHLRIDMPGLGKDDVKVSVEQNTLVIKGEGAKESDEEESGRRYSSRIDLLPNCYKMDGIKAEMKNGVLRIVVPKVKEEERTDVCHVKIDEIFRVQDMIKPFQTVLSKTMDERK